MFDEAVSLFKVIAIDCSEERLEVAKSENNDVLIVYMPGRLEHFTVCLSAVQVPLGT